MLFPEFTPLEDLSLLLLRVVLALVFLSSGWSHATEPEARGQSIGMSPGATRLLGVVELVAASLILVGLWTQGAALILMTVMTGAIWKKAFVWKTGMWGEEAGGGWYYDLLYLVCALVVLATAGGAYTLT